MSNFTQALKELTGFDDEKTSFDPAKNQKAAKTEPEYKPYQDPVISDDAFDFKATVSDIVTEPELSIGDFELKTGATKITPSMVITGSIKTDDDIVNEGYIIGDIVSTGNYKSTGAQIGKLKTQNALLSNAKQKGEITASSDVLMENDSAVVGNVKCNNIKLDSKVKGNITAEGRMVLLDNAMVVGNLTAESIHTAPSAKINGSIVLKALIKDFDIDVDFDELGGEF